MERNNSSKENKAMLLYNAMKPTLSSNNACEWQEKIIDAISTISSVQEEIKPDCIYWLLEIYKMFGKIDKIESEIMN
ncbi:hypothetical protein [uncultured Bacteroides sp.]|uniref:hypothetical protein n=1 Tax=uncultured Bacteroides sp. TaxID=162156 RepID=UPI0025930F12|nr:hypothetical protein [uncultured Bacteroides sp.]